MPIQKETACKGKAISNIRYITNREKTMDENGKLWVETVNMSTPGGAPSTQLYKEFLEVDKQFKQNQKYDDRKYNHTVINFKNTPWVTRDMVLEVGIKYANHFYPDHQSVVAVHGDHCHICTNTTNMVTGKKINRTPQDMEERKDFVNEISFEMFEIPPFDWRAARDAKRKKDKTEKFSGENNKYKHVEKAMRDRGKETELDVLRTKILRAALTTSSREAFKQKLSEGGVQLTRNTENTLSYKYADSKKGTVRGQRLGDYYTAEHIDRLLEYNRRKEQEAQRRAERRAEAIANANKEDSYYLVMFGVRQNELRDIPTPRLVRIYIRTIAASRRREGEPMDMRTAYKAGFRRKNGHWYFNGVQVKVDTELQRMYDAGLALSDCCEKYNCKTYNELTLKKDAINDALERTSSELRKERKIEQALKGQLKKKESLAEAWRTVNGRSEPAGSETFEAVKKAKAMLYHNGFKTEELTVPETLEAIKADIADLKAKVSAKGEITKSLFTTQKRLEREYKEIMRAQGTFDSTHIPWRAYQSCDFTDIETYEEVKAREDEERLAAIENDYYEDDPDSLYSVLEEAIRRSGTLSGGQDKSRTDDKDEI